MSKVSDFTNIYKENFERKYVILYMKSSKVVKMRKADNTKSDSINTTCLIRDLNSIVLMFYA